MATSYTTNLGLALPVTGELAGTWGTVCNQEITELLDSAIAGTTTLSSDADVTLTDTDGAANQSRQAILLWTANGTVTRTITAPARTKTYVVINATAGSQSIKLVGAGPTTGITLVANEKCLAAWNGSDFVKVASSVATGVTSISFGATGLTPSTGTAGDVTVSGTLAVASGGTGVTTSTGTGSVVLSNTPTLTTPVLGTPTSGNLSNCTADGTNAVGYKNIPAIADKTAPYSLQTADVGKVVGVGTGGSITIPNSTFAAGDAVLIFNNTAGDVAITCSITTAYIAGTDADKASVTLKTRGVCNVLFISGTVCVLTGNVS